MRRTKSSTRQSIIVFHHYSEPLLDPRNLMLAKEARKRGMKPYLHTNGDLLKHDDALCKEVKSIYGLIVVGLYDYEADEELEETKQFWRDRLVGANLSFSPIGLSGTRSAHSIGIPRCPRMHVWLFPTSHIPMPRAIVHSSA